MAAQPELWRPIPDWPYEASDRGPVRSVERTLTDGRAAGGVVLAPVPDKDGYLYVTLHDGDRSWRVHVARLVLLAHRGEPLSPEHEALHGNGRRRDCRLANLRWGTRAENRADRETHRKRREAARTARRAGRASVTGETGMKERETSEIDGAACCPGLIVSAAAESRRSRP